MTNQDIQPQKPLGPHRFQTGNRASVGYGRPRGSRALLGDCFLDDMHNAWKKHGKSVIYRVIKNKPEVFLKCVASIIPAELAVSVSVGDGLTADELAAGLAAVRAALAARDNNSKPVHGPTIEQQAVDITEAVVEVAPEIPTDIPTERGGMPKGSRDTKPRKPRSPPAAPLTKEQLERIELAAEAAGKRYAMRQSRRKATMKSEGPGRPAEGGG